MTVAVTHFEALCGFRPYAEIVRYLGNIPELRELVGEENASRYEAVSIFSTKNHDLSLLKKIGGHARKHAGDIHCADGS